MALPGVKTTILDRFYNLGRTDLPGGPTLAIIAKRNNAERSTSPNLEPFFAAGEQDVITEYGENSNLHRGYREASTAGASRIVLIPLPSNTVFDHGTGSLSSAGFTGDLFDEAFMAVEAVRADVVVPWGAGSDSATWDDVATPATPAAQVTDYFFADNTGTTGSSWVKKVADKCALITAESYPVFAVMGLKGLTGAENATTSEVVTGLNYTNLTNHETVTNGQFVTVVGTEVRPISYPSSWGWANGAATYAALATMLDAWRALTGKPVYNVDRIRWNPTRVQAEALNEKGVATARIDYDGTIRWVDALTFAPAASDFIRLTTLRIAFDAVKMILRVAQSYKGENMSLSAQNAFDTQIGSRLRAMQQVGAINNSDYRISYVPSENKAIIDLALAPAFELREIILKLSINF